MFSGLVETTGRVIEVAQATDDAPRRLTISCGPDLCSEPLGASVALDGCCLTVVASGAGTLAFEATTETLHRTTLGEVVVGQAINMERALRLGDRLGGHLVSGHVDAVGPVTELQQRASALYMQVRLPAALPPLVAPRGSITLAGVSLTVTERRGDLCTVALIPHTLAATTLGQRRVGDRLNIEVDLLARYVDNLLRAQASNPDDLQERAG